MGSRYGGLKQLDTFGAGEHALMEYSVFDAKKAGFEKVVFVDKGNLKGQVVEDEIGFLEAEIAATKG